MWVQNPIIIIIIISSSSSSHHHHHHHHFLPQCHKYNLHFRNQKLQKNLPKNVRLLQCHNRRSPLLPPLYACGIDCCHPQVHRCQFLIVRCWVLGVWLLWVVNICWCNERLQNSSIPFGWPPGKVSGGCRVGDLAADSYHRYMVNPLISSPFLPISLLVDRSAH